MAPAALNAAVPRVGRAARQMADGMAPPCGIRGAEHAHAQQLESWVSDSAGELPPYGCPKAEQTMTKAEQSIDKSQDRRILCDVSNNLTGHSAATWCAAMDVLVARRYGTVAPRV